VTNIAAPFIAQFYKEPMRNIMHSTDLIVCNETEALTWSIHNQFGIETDSDDNQELIARKLCEMEKN